MRLHFLIAALELCSLLSCSNSFGLSSKNQIKTQLSSSRFSGSGDVGDLLNMQTKRDVIKMPTATPMVPYKPPGSDYAQFVDLNSAMYRERTVMISSFIDEEVANSLISILLYIKKENPKQTIYLYFNVPGALLRPSLALYDLIQMLKETCEVQTVNLALCTGMGAFLCSAGTKGSRSAMPNSRFLLQRTGIDDVFRGQATDIALEVKNVKTMNDKMEKDLAEMTGQPIERIQNDFKRDFYLSSNEAVTYGLIDQVLLPSPLKRAARGQEADLGAFEGEEKQKYQGDENKEKNGGGWGSQKKQVPPPPKKKDDNDGPKTSKG